MILQNIKHDSRGIAAIGIVLVIVVVAAIGGVGYFVYQRQNNNAEQLNTSSDVQQVESELYEQDEALNSELDSDTAKLDEVTKETQ